MQTMKYFSFLLSFAVSEEGQFCVIVMNDVVRYIDTKRLNLVYISVPFSCFPIGQL